MNLKRASNNNNIKAIDGDDDYNDEYRDYQMFKQKIKTKYKYEIFIQKKICIWIKNVLFLF